MTRVLHFRGRPINEERIRELEAALESERTARREAEKRLSDTAIAAAFADRIAELEVRNTQLVAAVEEHEAEGTNAHIWNGPLDYAQWRQGIDRKLYESVRSISQGDQ